MRIFKNHYSAVFVFILSGVSISPVWAQDDTLPSESNQQVLTRGDLYNSMDYVPTLDGVAFNHCLRASAIDVTKRSCIDDMSQFSRGEGELVDPVNKEFYRKLRKQGSYSINGHTYTVDQSAGHTPVDTDEWDRRINGISGEGCTGICVRSGPSNRRQKGRIYPSDMPHAYGRVFESQRIR
jgi:hypothetical protein